MLALRATFGAHRMVAEATVWSTPTGVFRARRVDEPLNIRLDDAEPNIPVKLLSAVVEYQARAAFNAHFVGVLVVRGQSGKRRAVMDAPFDAADIGA